MYSLNALMVDAETKSKCDLKLKGADNYALHETTDILCFGFLHMQTNRKWLWFPGDAIPLDLVQALLDADFVMAHNARFDQQIYEIIAVNAYGFPEIDSDVWYCTAAQCRVNALPGGLDDAARALNGKHRKDHRGSALIRKLSIPQKDTGEFYDGEDYPILLKQMGEYCVQDLVVAADIVRNTRIMTEEEHLDWQVNERINDRGVLVDVEAATLAQQYAAQEQGEIAELLSEITDGEITKHTQHQRVKKWVLAKIEEDPEMAPIEKLMVTYKSGERKYSLDKSVRANILNAADSNELYVSDDVYDLVLLCDDGNKSSVAKFNNMLHRADDEDERVRGAFMYAGAGQTKRYSSKGLQVHNFVRDCFKADEAEDIIDDMYDGLDIDNVMTTLSKLLRPALIPDDDNVFVVGDWSAIEARCLPWLTADPDADATLDVFRRDEDIYMFTAKSMNTDDRQLGKVANLSLGYQGAVGAFNSMAKNYGLYLPEPKVLNIVKRWRAANPWATKFWKALEFAAASAVRNPGVTYPVGRLQYFFTDKIMGGTLLCILPSGEPIQYPNARLEDQQTDYGTKRVVTYLKASYSPAADAEEWPRGALYGGLLAENATQATAAALLRRALREMDQYDNVVLHVHDEIVCEVPEDEADKTKEILQDVMEFTPDWAEGLPLKAEPEVMYRYGK